MTDLDCPAADDIRQDAAPQIRQQYHLDAPPAKVWRALSIAALREQWLPGLDLAAPEPLHAVPQQEIRYAMRERQPPFLESQVTFRIAPAPGDVTLLTIVHVLAVQTAAKAHAANDSSVTVMRAA